MKRVYISGIQDIGMFNECRDFLSYMDLHAINSPISIHSGKELITSIQQLVCSDVVYMAEGWDTHRMANIEHDVAMMLRIPMIFEESCNIIRKLDIAIYEVTGYRRADYSKRGNQHEAFVARMIFAHHCRKMGMKLSDIAMLIHRHHSLVVYAVNKYDDAFRFDKQFRAIAEKVNQKLV
jgi:hypothetical protein